jgi:3-oxoadipate enol-lactonase
MPTIAINNIELYYEFKGNPDGPTLVFVNGLLTDTSSWNGHLAFFGERYRCLVYDCRGQGQSSKPDHVYETAMHAADLAGLVAALGIERAHFIGLSNGGAAVLDYAATHSERVSAVVASGAYAHVDTITRVKLTSWVKAMEYGGSPLRFDVATPWVWGGRFLEENYQGLLGYREKGANMPIEWAMNLVKGAMVHDIREKLPVVQAPTLVIVGEEDVLTPPSLSQYIAEQVPDSELYIQPGRGHASALEDVAGWSAVVLDFFRRVEARDQGSGVRGQGSGDRRKQ